MWNVLATVFAIAVSEFFFNYSLSKVENSSPKNKGECECQPEFSGKTCECSNLESNCIAPNSTEVCSGHGSCECNECQCSPSYSGKFCESSQGNGSLNLLCVYYEPCVQCVINRKLERECSDYKDVCSRNGNLYKSEFYDDISGKQKFFSYTRCKVP